MRYSLVNAFAIMALSDARAWKDDRLAFKGDTGVTFKFIFFCVVVSAILIVARLTTGHVMDPISKKFKSLVILSLGVILLISNLVVNKAAKTLQIEIEREMVRLAALPRKRWLRIKWIAILLFILGECGFLFLLFGSFAH